MMRGYAEVRDCRRKYLLKYFGEEFEAPCNCCDNCKSRIESEVEKADSHPFPLNSRVIHKTWGEGSVIRLEADNVVVLFEQVGYKTLGVAVARLYGVLRRVRE